ncbi:MAG: hypothetical protein NTW25_14660, partial [Candidatus Kapabacteria bacterium]|nr:hypothetical protein [Candidatus Kapabacteria bacterium]
MKIVETIINCNSGASSILSSKQIGFSNHDQNKNHNNYANPVINASKDGNFYSWSSQYGIISSFKKPQDYDFSTFGFDTIGVNNVGEGCSTMDFQHPSLNPYSIMFNANSVKNENQASLVFQGSNCLYEDNSYIYFSRLKLDSNNKVYHYQVDNNSTNYQYPKGSAFFFLDSGRTVRFHWGAKQGKFPSVYRSLKSTLFRYESIAWERRYATTNSQVFALNIMDINQFNSSNLSTWNITSIAHLSPAEGLGNDDAGKPVFGNPKEVDRSNYFNPELRGNTIMNFTWGNKIYHIPLDYNSTITDTSFVDEAKALRSIKYVANGKLPHLMNGP